MSERDDLFELWSRHGSSWESDSSEGRELADAIVAAGFRRPEPVTRARLTSEPDVDRRSDRDFDIATGRPLGPEPVTPDLAAIKSRADAATPGPWILDGDGEDEPEINYWAHRFVGTDRPDENGYHQVIATTEDGHGPNAQFIAHAREDIPALLAALESAERRLAPVTPETDQRILAWERIVWHPAFKPCFRDGKLIDHMMKRLDDLVELEATVNELAPAPVTPETETEWEYAIRTESTGKIEPDTEDGARWTAKYANIGAAGTETYTLMSRPVGPWLPVEDGGE